MKKVYVIKDAGDKDYFENSGLSSERNGYYANFTKVINLAGQFNSKKEAIKEMDNLVKAYPTQFFTIKTLYCYGN